MDKESIITIINENYDRFTNVEKIIADYFISNKQLDEFSIKNIKNKLYVSEASLTRFAKKCGFRGFREFIYHYEETLIKSREDKSKNFENVFHTYHQLLNNSYKIIDEQQIIKLSQMISKANKVLVLGIGSSALAAHQMQQRFMRLGVFMEACDSADIMKMQSVFQTEGSLVIGMSLRGTKQEVLYVLKHSQMRGAKTVLITSNASQHYPYVDEKIVVPELKNLNVDDSISPQLPLLIVVDLCYNIFLNDNRAEKSKLYQETIQSLE